MFYLFLRYYSWTEVAAPIVLELVGPKLPITPATFPLPPLPAYEFAYRLTTSVNIATLVPRSYILPCFLANPRNISSFLKNTGVTV